MFLVGHELVSEELTEKFTPYGLKAALIQLEMIKNRHFEDVIHKFFFFFFLIYIYMVIPFFWCSFLLLGQNFTLLVLRVGLKGVLDMFLFANTRRAEELK